MINWHPDEATLLAYSAGTLSTSYAVCVSAHLHYCPHCRAAYDSLNTLAATVLEEADVSDVSDSLLDDTLALLDDDSNASTPSSKAVTTPTEGATPASPYPPAIAKLLGDNVDKQWKWRWPKLRVIDLASEGNTTLSLYKISPGGKMPRHEHRGEELTLVLDGSFSDTYGTYRRGDIVARQENERHAPIASQSEDCVCLVLENATPSFSGVPGKIIHTAQKWFGNSAH